jgi:hypothetical protein
MVKLKTHETLTKEKITKIYKSNWIRNTNIIKDHNTFIGVEERNERVIGDKPGTFGLYAPPKMKEETSESHF